jgi:hypothetical protein
MFKMRSVPFAYPVCKDVHLLLTQIFCYKDESTTDIKMHKTRYNFYVCFVKFSPYRETFQIKEADFNEILAPF